MRKPSFLFIGSLVGIIYACLASVAFAIWVFVVQELPQYDLNSGMMIRYLLYTFVGVIFSTPFAAIVGCKLAKETLGKVLKEKLSIWVPMKKGMALGGLCSLSIGIFFCFILVLLASHGQIDFLYTLQNLRFLFQDEYFLLYSRRVLVVIILGIVAGGATGLSIAIMVRRIFRENSHKLI